MPYFKNVGNPIASSRQRTFQSPAVAHIWAVRLCFRIAGILAKQSQDGTVWNNDHGKGVT